MSELCPGSRQVAWGQETPVMFEVQYQKWREGEEECARVAQTYR